MWLLLTYAMALLPCSGECIATVQDLGLSLLVSNIREGHGALLIAAYDCADDFLTDRAIYTGRTPVMEPGTLEIPITNLAVGTYAISIFHDVNDNGKLDKNFLGIPTEPIGFSNNASGRMGPPRWGHAAFVHSGHDQIIDIALR